MGSDEEIFDPVKLDRTDAFLLKVHQPVEEPVKRSQHLAAVGQLQVDPCAAAEARDHRRDLFFRGHSGEVYVALEVRGSAHQV